jgi:ABC-2 type transport system ATP-binding protein
MSSEPAIHVEALSKSFGRITAVDSIGFDVPAGATIGLLGGNGAGKTTTIAMLLGLLTPDSGVIRLLGHDIGRDRFRALARLNFSSPYVELPHRLSVRENLSVFAHLYGVRRPGERIEELARDLQFEALLDRRTGTLSAGQKTRLSLAKALINSPELLLLDEPTASLDPDTADWVRGYLEELRKTQGVTILLAPHNMAEVERLCSSILMMRGGRIVDRGTSEELITRYGRDDLEGVFLAIARRQEQGTA